MTPLRRPLRLALLVIGLLLLGYTASGLVHERPLLTDADSADGVVVDVRKLSNGAATPVIRFAAGNGSTIDWASRDSGSYAVGDHVPVLYMPDAPGMAVVGSVWGILGRFVLTAVIGIACILFGLRATRPLRRGRTF